MAVAPERWQRIEQLYHSALGRAPGERAAYLAAECAGDEELRREVESLISNGQEGGAFLERPALEVAAERYVSGVTADLTGRKLGRYEVVSRLGAGGMGEVYRAHDTRLKREVALKVLPREWMADAERKRRFEPEARAASALDHPNIVTIHDIDQVDGVDFIAMEYVPGKTLDQVIPRRDLRLKETLQYAIEIAGALAAAHSAGIVHRDVKPSNLMVTGTGQVKVLDFGLAKLVEPAMAGEEGAASTLPVRTEEGAVVGTVSYMSPEQAQGKPIDARSDIFSFGSVLYEMVTGRRAFQADTKISTLAAIVEHEPPPLHAAVPQELEKVITRCLRKDPARRFQHMDDVQIALQELKEQSEASLPAGTPAAVRPSRRRWAWAAAAVVAVTLAGAIWWLRGTGTQRPWDVVPLTSYAGDETYPSFSPDGNQVVFSWDGEKRDNYDIYVKLIGSPTPQRLTTNPAADFSPAFSPDGRYIGFVRVFEKRAAFVKIPAIGGPELTVADVFAPYLSSTPFFQLFEDQKPGPLFAWLPDGKYVVTAGLTILSVETGEARSLTSPPPTVAPDFSPAVSPDGHTVAFARSSGYTKSELYLLDLGADLRPKGDPRRLTSLKRLSHSAFWGPDGRKIIFTTRLGFAQGLWKVAASGSTDPEPLPIRDAWTSAASRTGNRLVYSRAVGGSRLWRLSLSDSGEPIGPPARFIPSTRDEYFPQYSPDGKRIAFQSNRGGNNGIWVCDADGSNIVELFSQADTFAGTPRWAPDGQRLAFDSNAAGNEDIYIIRASGGKPVQLTADPADDGIASWSADGKWVYFYSMRSGRSEVWKAPAGGGEAVQVTRNGGWVAFESRDGRFIYYTKSDAPPTGLWRMPVGGGEESLAIPSIAFRNFEVVNDGIYFIEYAGAPGPLSPTPGKSSIRFLDFATGKVRTVFPIASWEFGFSVSPDGRSFLWVQNEWDRDLMLVENFRP